MLILTARILLAGVFGTAGFAKLADRQGSRRAMSEFGVPRFLVGSAAVLLPVAEIGCAIALLPLATAWFASLFAALLLGVFTAGIGVTLARGRRPDCHCFGQLHAAPIGWTTVVRNAVLLGVAGLVVASGRENTGMSLASAAQAGGGGTFGTILLLAGLAIVAFLLVMIFQLLRQNGRLLLRVEAIEAKLGIDPLAPLVPGLPVGATAPTFMLPSLDDGRVSLAKLRYPGHPVLLVFVEPGCSACDALLPDIASWQATLADRLTVAVVSPGDAEANRAKLGPHRIRRVLLQKDREASESYKVSATPSAVLITDGAVANPLAAGADAIRALVVKTTVPHVKRGGRAPSLQLSDLDGQPVNLDSLNARRTVLLFWNPSCGFCQRMLDDLRAWERTAAHGSPSLVVVSAGTAEANRKQGFRSTILLDEHFHAGQAFGVTGTPSAVMLDDSGRVVSDVVVGAPAVLELAGLVAQLTNS